MVLRRLTAVFATSGVLAGVIWSYRDRFQLQVAKANNSNPYTLAEAIEQYKRGIHKWNPNWDQVEPTPTDQTKNGGDKEKKSVGRRHLFLIRHGHYNKEKLTKMGEEQAKLTGERLKLLKHDYSIMYFSSMVRATETKDIISRHIPKVRTEKCDLIKEGRPFPTDPSSNSWPKDFFEQESPIEKAFCQYFHRASQEADSYEILVCHANVIRYFVCRALQLPPEAWGRMDLPHGSITWITIRADGRVKLKCLGDSGHFPKDKVTYSRGDF